MECRYLDLSRNKVTLDIDKQRLICSRVFAGLHGLRYFSMAFNTLQDKGFAILMDVVFNYLGELQVLDVAKCYITSECLSSIKKLIESKESRLNVLYLQMNMFTIDQLKKIRAGTKNLLSSTNVVEGIILSNQIRIYLNCEYTGIEKYYKDNIDLVRFKSDE